jgi:hypothetical protein
MQCAAKARLAGQHNHATPEGCGSPAPDVLTNSENPSELIAPDYQ